MIQVQTIALPVPWQLWLFRLTLAYYRLLFSFHKSEEEIQTEQSIIEKAQQDPKHFSQIYDSYYDQIFIFIIKRVASEETSAELTSQVFYKALYSLKRYKFQGLPFSAWLYRIASNQVAEYFRKKKSETRHVELDQDHLRSLSGELETEFSEDLIPQLVQLLEELHEKELQLIEMRFFEDMSYKEIGQILKLTENNAKVKTFRVIQKMKKIAEQLNG